VLDSINTAKVAGLHDRALIGLMVYSFARIGAAFGMTVENIFTQNRRLWVRLREKGGKRHAIPCHHNLEEYLTAYLDGAGLRGDPAGTRRMAPAYARAPGRRGTCGLVRWPQCGLSARRSDNRRAHRGRRRISLGAPLRLARVRAQSGTSRRDESAEGESGRQQRRGTEPALYLLRMSTAGEYANARYH
jgi:integrase